MPASCMCGCVRACCIPHSASSACGCTHFVLIFLEAHSCPLSLSSSSFPTISCGGKGEQGGRKQSSYAEQAWAGMGRQWDEHHQPRSALACHVLLDADAKHTQYHTSPTSLPPRRPLHLLLITAFPFPLSLTMRHTTTKKVSAPPCSRASTHAIAAMGRWCGVGRGSNRREEEEEAQHLTHSHMYHLLLVCACVACRWRRTWAAGGDEREW